jgi:hypothetical protein
MSTKKTDEKAEKADKESTEGQATDAKGNVLAPGTMVPQPGTEQDKELAEKGIYQPADQAFNRPAPAAGTTSADPEAHKEHEENLRTLPPVPSERAGAASQAK